MMRRVATLRSKQYGEYRLSAINYSRESLKSREYLTEFEAKFEKSLKTEKVAWEESICEKISLDCPFKVTLIPFPNITRGQSIFEHNLRIYEKNQKYILAFTTGLGGGGLVKKNQG